MGAPSTSQLLKGNPKFVVASTVKGSPLKLVKLIWNAHPANAIAPFSMKFTGWDEAVVNVRSPPRTSFCFFHATMISEPGVEN